MPAADVEFVNWMGVGCWAWVEMGSELESRHTKKNVPTLTLPHRSIGQNVLVTVGAFQTTAFSSQFTRCGAALEQHSLVRVPAGRARALRVLKTVDTSAGACLSAAEGDD
jgi:hypothetical protein